MMRVALLGVLFSVLLSACAMQASWPDAIVDARENNRPAPVRHHARADLSLAEAYAIQGEVVERLIPAGDLVGYKGGLTIADSWLRFKLREPVVGAMAKQGSIDTALSLQGFNRLVIELELAFVFNRRITAPLADVAELKTSVAAIHPAVELPDLGYEDMTLFSGMDLIANNVSAHRYKLGPAFAQGINVDAIKTALRCNETLLSEGSAGEVQGGQWQTLLWLVNKLLSVGYTIEPGQFVLTGSLGKVVPAASGDCIATLGDKQIAFQLTE